MKHCFDSTRTFRPAAHITALFFLSIVVGFGAPPTIVSTTPANGAKNVSPKTSELVVKFSQDMDQRGFSWMNARGGAFPPTDGKSVWKSPRICALRIGELEEGKTYAFGINSKAGGNFRSKAGESAKPVSVVFTVAEGGAPADSGNAASFKALRAAVDERYSYRDLRAVDWKKEFSAHQNKILAAKSQRDFATRAAQVLKVAKDVHVWLEVDGKIIPTFQQSVESNHDAARIVPRLKDIKKPHRAVASGTLSGGIGYLAIASWEIDTEAAMEALLPILNSKAIVIDVRMNSGGNELVARDVAGCFVKKPAAYAKHRVRDSSKPGGFGKIETRTFSPNPDGHFFEGKVAVLMGKTCMSSCEAFLLMMRQAPNARLFGENSRGSSGNPRPVVLPNEVTMFLPSWQALELNEKCFEGVGIAPDQKVRWTKSGSSDPVLDAALQWIRK